MKSHKEGMEGVCLCVMQGHRDDKEGREEGMNTTAQGKGPIVNDVTQRGEGGGLPWLLS